MQQKKGYHRIPVCPINRKWSRNACREGEGRGEGGRRIVEVVPKGASYRTYILYSVSKLVHSRLIRFEFPSALTILWIMRVTRSKRRKRKNSSNFQRSLFIRIWIKGETRDSKSGRLSSRYPKSFETIKPFLCLPEDDRVDCLANKKFESILISKEGKQDVILLSRIIILVGMKKGKKRKFSQFQKFPLRDHTILYYIVSREFLCLRL